MDDRMSQWDRFWRPLRQARAILFWRTCPAKVAATASTALLLGIGLVPALAETPTSHDVQIAPIADAEVTTSHTATLGKERYHYTAHVGTLTLHRDDGQPYVQLFYVAYLMDKAPAGHRPVTFLYNGGPGSATLWMHIGGWGPARISTRQALLGKPEWTPNPDSLLGKSDLVFIDAPETGYSHLVGNGKITDIAGIDQDIDAYARFIETYLSKTNRWSSPKYIFGESYGTPRSAGLAAALHVKGISLNGVILQSTVLDYNRRAVGADISYAITLPSYAAIAWHFGKAPRNETEQKTFIDEAQRYAEGPYLHALFAGDAISPEEKNATADQLAKFTGLSRNYILASNLRISVARFRKELLRDRKLVLGRYDARVTGADDDAAGEQSSWDPSDEAITNSYAAAFQTYLQTDLHYRPAGSYLLLNYPLNKAWSEIHTPFMSGSGNGGKTPLGDLSVDLGAAMRADQHMWVFSSNGLYDLGTPFTGAEHDLSHLELDPDARRRIRFGYYQAGHMVYADDEAIGMLARDLGRFYDDSCGC